MVEQEQRVISLNKDQVQGIERYANDADGMHGVLQAILSGGQITSAIGQDIQGDMVKYMHLKSELYEVAKLLREEGQIIVRPSRDERDRSIRGAEFIDVNQWRRSRSYDWHAFRSVIKAIQVEGIEDDYRNLDKFILVGGEITFMAPEVESVESLPDNMSKFPHTQI